MTTRRDRSGVLPAAGIRTDRCCLVHDLNRARLTGPAASCNTKTVFQVLDARCTEFDGLADLTIRNCIAHADVHL